MKGGKFYSDSIKREVNREVKSGFLSKIAARRKYDIPGVSTIIGWIRKFDGPTTNNRQAMAYKKSDK